MNNKISLQDLAESLSRKSGMGIEEAGLFVKSFFDIISENVVTDKIVKIKGLGTFKLIDVLSRESINVNTGERFVIPGHSKVSFTPDADLKSKVNKPFELFQTVVINEQTSLDDMERVDAADEDAAQYAEADGGPAAPESVAEAADADYEEAEDTASPQPEEAHAGLAREEAEPAPAEKKEARQGEPVVVGGSFPVTETPEAGEEKAAAPSEPEARGTVAAQCAASCAPCQWKRCLVMHMAFSILLAFVLMLAGYFAGYYRILCPCEETTARVEQPAKKQERPAGKQEQPAVKQEQPIRAAEPKADADSVKAEKKDTVAARPKVDWQAMAARYEQVPGGEYLIVGTLKTREMCKGDNLYKFAKEELGDKNLIQYIIVHNGFSTPDRIPLGYGVKIPRLKKN